MGIRTELRQSDRYARYMQEIGWEIEQGPHGQYAYVRRVPLLPLAVMKVQRIPWQEVDFDWIDRVAKKHRVMYRYVELAETVEEVEESGVVTAMKQQRYRPTKSGMLPTKTWVIDLQQHNADMLEQMKGKTRYNLGLAQRKGLDSEILTGKDILKLSEQQTQLFTVLKANARRLGLWGINESQMRVKWEVFGKHAIVVLVRYKGEVVAASEFFEADTVLYYGQNGSTEMGRRLMTPTLAVWKGIQEGKRRNLHQLDFDGIYDERFPLKRWKGFSRFKQSFGGKEKCYLPAFTKWL